MPSDHPSSSAPETPETVPPVGQDDATSLFRALGSRNYRLFFAGQAVSLTGFWMQKVATGWLVYRLTRSPLALGVVDFAGSIPLLLLTPFTGALLERWNLKNTFFLCQALCCLQSLALAALTLTGLVSYAQLVVLNLFLGVVNAFEMPTRHSLVPQLVDQKEDLGNALALNSSLFNVARLVGPSVAGFAIARMGEGPCFLANALTYSATLMAILALRLPPQEGPSPSAHGTLGDLREGWRYSMENVPIRLLLLLLSALSWFAFSYLVMLPAVARDVLGGDSQTLGFLTAATGIGGITGSLLMARRRSPQGLDRLVPRAATAFGAAIAAFALSRHLILSMVSVGFAGFFMVLCLVGTNTLLQLLVDDDKRSRVMGLYILAVMGMAPFGSLLTGALGKVWGTPAALFLGGLATVASGLGAVRAMKKQEETVRNRLAAQGLLEGKREG